MATSTYTPGDPVGVDPAAAGDPFVRVRYRYGMLLGAEELTLEQRAHLLRHRIHQALLHGAGTVWGLKVGRNPEKSTELIVEPGWAIDALGRELYVPRRQCLDIASITLNPIWAKLSRPDPTNNHRRAYVVLRHVVCETQPVVAIRPACSEPADAMPFSRVVDSYRIDIEATAPPPPEVLLASWLDPANSLRLSLDTSLLELLTGPAKALGTLWDPEAEAPLLLAVVDLLPVVDANGTPLAQLSPGVHNPDNRDRPLLTPSWLLQHRGLQEAGLRVATISIEHPSPEAHELRVALTGEVDERTLGAVRVMELRTGGWEELTSAVSLAGEGRQLVVQPAGATPGERFQISLVGAGPRPLMAVDGGPLAGWLTDPPVRGGQGRDVGFVGNWMMGGGE